MKYIALLRGINVGSHKRILMADLRALLTKAGFENVETYIQSGNIVLISKKNPVEIEKIVKTEIHNTYGFEVPVVVRNADEWNALFDQNPYPVQEMLDRIYVTFLHELPDADRMAVFEEMSFDGDVFKRVDKHIFLCFKTKTSNSKLTNNLIESKLKVKATSRNWKTVLKLKEML